MNKEEFEIKIKQLKQGMEFKNYKCLAQFLGEDTYKSKQKQLQINRWKRYFDFVKAQNGQSLTIIDVYPEPFPTDDARKAREGLYVKYIELLLLEFLSHQKGQQVEINKHNLFAELGIIGNNFEVENRSYDIIKKDINYLTDDIYTPSTYDIKHFYQRAYQKINDILKTALRSMRDRRLINYKTNTYIIKRDEVTGLNVPFLANDEEETMLLNAEKRVLSDMGLSTVTQVYLKFKAEEYYSRVQAYVQEKYDWKDVYTRLSIIYVNDIADQIPLKAEEIRHLSYIEKQRELNQKIIKSLNKQADNNYKKFEDTIFSLDYDETSSKTPFCLYPNYVDIQNELAKYLIGLDSKSFIVPPKD